MHATRPIQARGRAFKRARSTRQWRAAHRKLALPKATLPAATATAAASAAITSSAASAAALFTRPRFVDRQVASLELFFVQAADRFLGGVVILHFHESKTLA